MTKYYVADTENLVPKSTLMDDADESNMFESNTDIGTVDVPDHKGLKSDFVTRVWAFAVCPVGADTDSDDVSVYNSIEGGLDHFANLPNPDNGITTVFFHNLAYDGPLIISHLVGEGYVIDEPEFGEEAEMLAEAGLGDSRRPAEGHIRTQITDGAWYSMQICFRGGKQVEIRDSLKLLPFTVDAIGKSLKTKAKKLVGGIDYTSVREVGHVITDEEQMYIENDVLVMAQALDLIERDFPGYLTNLTIGSACMKMFKMSLGARNMGLTLSNLDVKSEKGATLEGKEEWEAISEWCTLDEDAALRQSYRGGWCYVNRENPLIYRNQAVDLTNTNTTGMVYDVNSLYPSVMYKRRYPWGNPMEYHAGNNMTFDEIADFSMEYIIELEIDFVVREDHVPFIQLKGSSAFAENEYVRDSGGPVKITLTKPDVELFREQYEVRSFTVHNMWVFDHVDDIFDDYIDHFYAVKERATKEGNAVLRMIAKLHLNNLYGKMAQSSIRPVSIPVVTDGVISIVDLGEDVGRGGYIPIGAYITAYARAVTIRAAQSNYDRFFYADTDSIHILGEAKGIEVDGSKLGAWDNEGKFDMARYVRQKTYVERIINGDEREIDLKACGASGGVKERLRYRVAENDGEDWHFNRINRDDTDKPINEPRTDREIIERFQPGLKEAGKLTRKSVSGGTILLETTFSIHGEPCEPEWEVVR